MNNKQYAEHCRILDKKIRDHYETLENDVETGFYDYVKETCEFIIELCDEHEEILKQYKAD